MISSPQLSVSEQDALDERLRDDLPARCADGEAHGRLRAARDRAGEQQVRDIRTRDEQHDTAHRQEDLQAASVLFFHHADAGAGRHDGDHLVPPMPRASVSTAAVVKMRDSQNWRTA